MLSPPTLPPPPPTCDVNCFLIHFRTCEILKKDVILLVALFLPRWIMLGQSVIRPYSFQVKSNAVRALGNFLRYTRTSSLGKGRKDTVVELAAWNGA